MAEGGLFTQNPSCRRDSLENNVNSGQILRHLNGQLTMIEHNYSMFQIPEVRLW